MSGTKKHQKALKRRKRKGLRAKQERRTLTRERRGTMIPWPTAFPQIPGIR